MLIRARGSQIRGYINNAKANELSGQSFDRD